MTAEQQRVDSPASDDHEGPTLQEILIPIWANRKRILLISFVVALVTLGINFLLPVYYKSTATLLPETQKDKLSALGQFADIANLAGVSVPGSEIARLYPTIVNSETILRSVIFKKYKTEKFADSTTLLDYFDFDEETEQKKVSRAINHMRDLLDASYEAKTSIVHLNLEMQEPELSAVVLNEMIAQLDEFMRKKRLANASEQVRWLSVRIADVSKELKEAEEDLRRFREANRQVSFSPQLSVQQERLIRNVQVNSAIYVELRKQMELARLEEVKNTTIVNVLDVARPPVKKDRPKRATNSILAFLGTMVVLSMGAAAKGIYGEQIKRSIRALQSSKRS